MLAAPAKVILTAKFTTPVVKMRRFSRRPSGPRYRKGAGRLGWNGRALTYGSSASRRLFLGGSKSLAGAMSRVHTFKRVGEPLYIINNNAAGYTLSGNTDMVAAGAQLAFNNTPAGMNSRQILGALRFCLSQAANITEITNLFDNYRISRVKLQISFTANSAPGSTGPNPGITAIPTMHHCYDPDDSVVPGGRIAVLENGYCKTVKLDRMISVVVTPRAQQNVVGGAGGAGGLLPTGTWLDSASPAIYHYGLKFCLDDFPYIPTDGMAALVITPTFYIEGKNVV